MNNKPYRIRRYGDHWCVHKWSNYHGHWVWEFITAVTTWDEALGVVKLETASDGYPFGAVNLPLEPCS